MDEYEYIQRSQETAESAKENQQGIATQKKEGTSNAPTSENAPKYTSFSDSEAKAGEGMEMQDPANALKLPTEGNNLSAAQTTPLVGGQNPTSALVPNTEAANSAGVGVPTNAEAPLMGGAPRLEGKKVDAPENPAALKMSDDIAVKDSFLKNPPAPNFSNKYGVDDRLAFADPLGGKMDIDLNSPPYTIATDGETLTSIAKAHNIEIKALREHNSAHIPATISDTTPLKKGGQIWIDAASSPEKSAQRGVQTLVMIESIDPRRVGRSVSAASLQTAAKILGSPAIDFSAMSQTKNQNIPWSKLENDFHLTELPNEKKRADTGNTAMLLNEKIKPSAALKKLMEPLLGGEAAYQMECAMHTQAVFLYAVMLDMEKEAPGSFDLTFVKDPSKKAKNQTFEFVLDTFVSSNVHTNQVIRYDSKTKAYYDVSEAYFSETVTDYAAQGELIGKTYNSNAEEAKLIQNAAVGTRLCFTAKGQASSPDWQNENVLKIGEDMYSAHPFGVVNYAELMAGLKKHHEHGYRLTQVDALLFDDSALDKKKK